MDPLTAPTSHRAAVSTPASGRWLLISALAVIAYATLLPSAGARSASLTRLACLVCGDFGAVDVVLNTLLFLPFGLSLGILSVRWSRAGLLALLVALGIELLQYTLIPGRDSSLSDVLTNAAGGTLGAWFVPHWRRLLVPDERTARALFTALVLGWVLTRLTTAWLLMPSFPDTRWYGQVAPKDVYPADFRGSVLHGELGGVPARSGEMPSLNGTFSAPEVEVRALVTGVRHTDGLASVLSVLDENQLEVLVLGQEGDAARLRFRLRTADLRFRTPSLRLDRALATATDDRTELVGKLNPGTLTLESTSATDSVTATLTLGPGLGWALLLPFDLGLTPAVAEVGTAAATALALVMIGFFAGRAWPGKPLHALVASVVASAVGLWLPLFLFPEASLAATEAIAAVCAALLGCASGLLARAANHRFS